MWGSLVGEMFKFIDTQAMLQSSDHKRLQELSQRCADTHSSEDIWEHLIEECMELCLAFERVRRRREPIENLIEELIDVNIECNTVLTMIGKDNPIVADMLKRKLDKFEMMLDKEKENAISTAPIDRYKAIPEIY
jgi:NTP pyrophosphatase (non-canonical NTP hydrolase)